MNSSGSLRAFGKRVGEAVAEVELRRMIALAELLIGSTGEMGLLGRDGRDLRCRSRAIRFVQALSTFGTGSLSARTAASTIVDRRHDARSWRDRDDTA